MEVVDVVAAVGDVSDAGRVWEPLGVRRGVNMEKNFFTPCCGCCCCWPLDWADGEDEELAAVVAGGEVGGDDMSVGVGGSAAAVDAAGLLEPDVRRLNIAESDGREQGRLLTNDNTTL